MSAFRCFSRLLTGVMAAGPRRAVGAVVCSGHGARRSFSTLGAKKAWLGGTLSCGGAGKAMTFRGLPGIPFPHAVYTPSFHTSVPVSNKQDFYEVLGVPRTATQKEIEKAYYQLMAKKYHPDTNKEDPQAKEQFAQLAEAYEVLRDEVKRKQYDSAGFDAGQAGEGQHESGQTSHVDPEELLRTILEKLSRDLGFGDFNAKVDEPHECHMDLTFTQTVDGVTEKVSIERKSSYQVKANEPGTK
ncbi:dnaJ homolog subfamily A member 3, mitochondrial-like [Gouania willdenowi]|uniref:DnaJ homolog subfamily A member 3, mitochondrial-like n=1 Tax=Gouania willdenowi TaxID=441366 RepID=A0A8C5GJ97_GOUWI|nr:dnaJ homolog subfamily A member 3, mitochondrial-like [Gouania willdenowi]XP_028297655.1 dnaJ homolog subfamily A member 3, mitochondrial-like [Gouania willdenowi]XP_028297656.1 dnaJ homolog subfamily A member 3, mitochondrial-like [Gouania willdenowi]XP_028297657.1 dnaJ homolog subfamily A member 3, mitochondrial-like [Gouania willdenowi]XP_028297658.1 dnaJ homolog subfamily A member 3, mitochondrial-like [Gouania willdenowi]